MATLRELAPQAFDTAPVGHPAAASRDRWVVLVNDDGVPVSALAPGTTLAHGAVPPGVIVAGAELSQGEAYSSGAFAESGDAAALVLIEGGDGREIAGVVGGPELRRAVMRGAIRSGSGTSLPGPPAIPWIARSCSYAKDGTGCATVMTFTSRPAVMPDCANRHRLAAHRFRW